MSSEHVAGPTDEAERKRKRRRGRRPGRSSSGERRDRPDREPAPRGDRPPDREPADRDEGRVEFASADPRDEIPWEDVDDTGR